jgi:hypothetical protein
MDWATVGSSRTKAGTKPSLLCVDDTRPDQLKEIEHSSDVGNFDAFTTVQFLHYVIQHVQPSPKDNMIVKDEFYALQRDFTPATMSP